MNAPRLAALAVAALSALPVSAASLRATKSFVSDTTLSVFVEALPERCTWLRVDPVQGRRELVAELPRTCAGLSVSWSPDGSRAIIEVPGVFAGDGWRGRHAWIADLATLPATLTALPLSDADMLDLVAFDTDGHPVAIYLEEVADPAARIHAKTLRWEGETFAVPQGAPGLPVLAHAYRYERGAWRRIETVATTVEACDAPGALLLDAAHRLAPTTARMLDPAFGHDLAPGDLDASLYDRLEPYERIDAEATYAWVRLATERGTVLAVEGGFEYAFLTTPVLLVDEDGIHELEGMGENAVLAAASRGRYLLLTEAVRGSRPLLYDLDGGRLLFTSQDAVGVTFWP